MADLAAAGLAVEAPRSPNGTDDFLTTWITDPDGNRIELIKMARRSRRRHHRCRLARLILPLVPGARFSYRGAAPVRAEWPRSGAMRTDRL